MTLDSRWPNAKEENNNLGLSLMAAKTFDELEERLQWLKKCMLEKQEGCGDNLKYLKPDKRYIILPSL